MKLTDRIYLVGSGATGFSLTDPGDCHVYLVDGGGELALVDAGTGKGVNGITKIIREHGFDPSRIRYLLLTHLHADHAGGAAAIREAAGGLRVGAAGDTADALRDGDEDAIGLSMGKKGGYYEPGYRFESCPVELELAEGSTVSVGDLTMRCLETPGHCAGHLTFLVECGGRRCMFSGDNLFFGGRILLQPIPDCDLQAHLRSIRKLEGLGIDVFLPGHGCISLNDGQRHVDQAVGWMERCLTPPSFL